MANPGQPGAVAPRVDSNPEAAEKSMTPGGEAKQSAVTSKRMAAGVLGLAALCMLVDPPMATVVACRLLRNIGMPERPADPKPIHEPCSDDFLVRKAALVVTVKDTCSQKYELLEHLYSMFPREMQVIYAGPDMPGCRDVPASQPRFPNFKEITIAAYAPPIQGFLDAHTFLGDKEYTVLMHNDAYPMTRNFVCEMVRALDLPRNSKYPIAAPTIYEMGEKGIFVPHGHHQNLHVRKTGKTGPSGREYLIDYDLSLDLVSRREEHEHQEGPQIDFLEDHAFMARTSLYPQLLDAGGSFTMEYMDMILNMRARNTSAFYVPTATVVFDVSLPKIRWYDVPYFSYKRSEHIGHQLAEYLSSKWDVQFFNSGIWNFVRYAMLCRAILRADALPPADHWEQHAALFFSWFESLGFNRYNGATLPAWLTSEMADARFGLAVNISRVTYGLPVSVPESRVPPQYAHQFLHLQDSKAWYMPTLAFDSLHLPIGVKQRSCSLKDPTSYSGCGLVVADDNATDPLRACQCYTYVQLFDLKSTYFLDMLMTWMKLPTRALMYGQMKHRELPDAIYAEDVTIRCDKVTVTGKGRDSPCSFRTLFTPTSRIVQWSWYGDTANTVFQGV